KTLRFARTPSSCRASVSGRGERQAVVRIAALICARTLGPLDPRTVRSLVVVSTMALLISGCTVGRFYRGVPLRADPSALVEGESTKSDVLRLFGPPWQVSHQTNGDAFVYLYQQQNWSS